MNQSDETEGSAYQPETATSPTRYDWSLTPPSTAVIEEVTAAAGCEFDELPPLYEAINPDALDEFFCHRPRTTSPVKSVSFVYAGYAVTVRGSGAVTVRPQQAE